MRIKPGKTTNARQLQKNKRNHIMNFKPLNTTQTKPTAKKTTSFYPLMILFILVFIMGSCVPHKKLVYLQQLEEEAEHLLQPQEDYKVKPGDILHIQVMTLDEKSYAMFNTDRIGQRTTAASGIGNMHLFLHGYSVNDQGKITMPVLGEVDVEGKTIKEITQQLDLRIADYLIGATVIVKMANFSVTVLGEVGSQGKKYIYDNKVSIIDVLASSGGLTDFGNRQVTIVRQTGDKASFGTIDLTQASALSSEFFYLQPNDIIYVEPFRIKRLGISTFPFALVFSTISTTLLLINYFK